MGAGVACALVGVWGARRGCVKGGAGVWFVAVDRRLWGLVLLVRLWVCGGAQGCVKGGAGMAVRGGG
ncbi:hypothetical protein MNL09_07395 [Bartonella krasnovii]|nr:hypothetical protein MNL09_07395 [Bartonella krasnovii]